MMRIVAFLLLVYVSGYAQDGSMPWERLGLSKTEWLMIRDNNLPMKTVEILLKAGIDIGEYLNKPWEKFGLLESKWIEKRRSGMTSYDIELEATSVDQDWKSEVKENFQSEMGALPESGSMLSSLLLPGYQQMKADQKVRGVTMISLAAGSIIWCTAGSIANRQFQALPVFCIFVPDMVWSFIDYKITGKNRIK